jgi:hypothetical protein
MSDKKIPVNKTADKKVGIHLVADTIVGMSINNAVSTFPKTRIRVMKRDGKFLVGTQELRADRINVEVTDGTVVSVLSLG